MNSLQELNNGSAVLIEFNDGRPATVTFDRTTPVNQEVTTTQNTTHSMPVGIQIVEVINYSTSLPTLTVNVSAAAGATVTWPTVPSGCVVSNPSTGVYIITGIKSAAVWDIVKSPTILSPTGINNDFWQYSATVTYNTTSTKVWYVGVYVGTVTVLSNPTNTTYTSGTTNSITGEPQIQYPGSAPTWTVTVTPELTDAVTTLSSAGSGGTSTFNTTTKVLTLVGTKTQVNSHLAAISVVSAANNHWTYNLTYVAVNNTDIATATKNQQLSSTDTAVLLATVSDETYSINEIASISNGPQINDAAASGYGTYTTTVYPIAASAVSLIDRETNFFQSVFNLNEGQKIKPSDLANSDNFGNSVAMSGNGNVLAIGTRLQDFGAPDVGAVYIYTRTSIYSTTWTFRVKMDGGYFPSVASGDQIGWSVALSDGTTSPLTLAVGAVSDDNSAGTDAGSVYIFTSTDSGVSWSYQTRLQLTDAFASDAFGYSVSLSGNGNVLIVGAYTDDTGIPDNITSNGGSVSAWSRSGSTWTQIIKHYQGLSGTVPVQWGVDSYLGYSCAISNDGLIMAAGAPGAQSTTSPFPYTGGVFTYRSTAGSWAPTANLKGSDSANGDEFGKCVSLNSDGTYLAVGAHLHDNSNGTNAGSVYIFTRSGETWTQQTRLQAVSFTTPGQFGHDVKLNSDASILAISAIGGTSTGVNVGSIYIFTRSGTTWTESQVLDASDSSGVGDSFFGQSIALNSLGNSLAVGCMLEDTSPTTDQGAVYMFNKIPNITNVTWNATSKTYTIVENRYVTNAILNNLLVTPSDSYDQNFNLIYTTTTPSAAVATHNQRITRI